MTGMQSHRSARYLKVVIVVTLLVLGLAPVLATVGPGPQAATGASLMGNDRAAVGPEANTVLSAIISPGGASYPAGCGNLPALQSFASTVIGGNPPYTYNWSFGDGSSNSSLANPIHSYAAFGEYRVSLQVTDSSGSLVISNRTIGEGVPTCVTPVNSTNPPGSPGPSNNTNTSISAQESNGPGGLVLPIGIMGGAGVGVGGFGLIRRERDQR
jgi:PKD domain